uniref:EF-hand domain-containing protein n=1 Tax=Favella ehrenbergii TaxID=182087 RepID=A0A7S3MKG2_9SPIT|mmetsp:Transcript_15028/g.18996  ORF Transcript_15028/g.18996 Transcript_15028/m.18996 type:complete len:541 (+) Transcript_15028:12-1634(+)
MSLGFESERRLKELLVAVGDGERGLEAARQRLSSIRDFAPHSAFQRFDRDCNAFVSSIEILNFLRDQRNFTVSESETYRLVRFFDSDEDGRLSFQDFLQMLLPCTDNLMRNITLDRPSLRVGRFDSLPYDIERALLDILEKEVDLMRRLDILKREVEIRYDFSSLAAYRSIDRYNDGRINTFNLGTFLRSVGHYASETELLAIVRRIDTDGDAQLSYSEFAEFIRSTCPPSRGMMESSERAASAERYRRRLLESRNTSPLRPQTSPRAFSATRHSSPLRPSSPYRNTSPARISPEPLPRYSSPSRKPVLPLRDEDQLVNGLRDLIQTENEIEREKTSLALKPDFNLTDAFKIFDVNYLGSITVTDLREGLAAIGVFPTSEELDLFITRYDTTGDRRLNMREFSDSMLTLDAYYASMSERRGSNHRYPLYRRDDCFMPDTQLQFRSVWRQHFRGEVAAEAVRQRLQRQPYFNVYDAFNSLDMNDSGAISREEFRRLIQSRGFYVSDKEATEIVEKMDKNKNGRVSFAEFREEIMPRSPVRH